MPGMFLGQMEKPDVDYIDGLSPAISIDQKTTSKNPRSTVGTVTEIYDYLRLLYARIGIPHCPGLRQGDQAADGGSDGGPGARPAGGDPDSDHGSGGARRKGEHAKELESARRSGYVRVRVDGNLYDLTEEIKLDKNKKHNIEIVVDRLVVKAEIRTRLADSLETALASPAALWSSTVIDGEDMTFSQEYACAEHGVSIEELSPRMFSFNNPFGACPKCTGLGTFMKIDPDLDPQQGALHPTGGHQGQRLVLCRGRSMAQMYYEGLAEHYGFSLDTPIKDLPKEVSGHPALRKRRRKADHRRETGTRRAAYSTDLRALSTIWSGASGRPAATGCGRRSHGWMSARMPRVPRRAAEEGGAGRNGGRHQYQTSSARCRWGTSWSSSTIWS